MSDTNVLDLRENLPELKILYGEVDIKSVGKDLSVIIFRVKNIGGAPILGGYYDATSPLTISLSNGEFLKFEKISASNEYLANSAIATKISPSSIRLPSVIMEPGENYTIKALVIHAARTATILKSSGKVAGMRNIPVMKIESDKESESFWSKALSGSTWIQLARAPLYFFIFIFGLMAIFGPPIAISEWLQTRSRKKSISQFQKHSGEEMPEGHKAIFECYVENGLAPLVRARELLSDEPKLAASLKSLRETQRKANPDIVNINQADYLENHGKSHVILNKNIASRIINDAAIAEVNQDEIVQIDHQREKFLGKFIDYITIKES